MKEKINEWYKKIEEQTIKILEKFNKKFQEDPLSAISDIEDYIKAYVRIEEASRIASYLSEINENEILSELDRIKKEVRQELLNIVPQHNCSSIMEFLKDLWIYESKVKFWRNNIFSDIERLTILLNGGK